MDNTKKKLTIALFVIGSLLILIGGSYAIATFVFTGQREQRIDIKGLTFNYEEQSQGLTLTNMKPLNDTNGLASGNDYTFTVSATSESPRDVDYFVYLALDDENTLSNDYVRVNITNQTNNNTVGPKNISELGIKNDLNNEYYLIGDKLQFTDSVTSISHTYKLTIWVNENYLSELSYKVEGKEQTTSLGGEVFKFKINVATGVLPPQTTILSLYQSEKLYIGDFITYDAGVWVQDEIDSIQVGPNDGLVSASGSTSLPSTAYEFGGFEEGQSRNVGAI